jgi:hypothetical protein
MAIVTITVLSEDGSPSGQSTVLKFIKRAAVSVCATCQPQNLKCEPREETLQKQTISGNLWKCEKPQDHAKIVQLKQYLATRLGKANSLVFYHFDGDVPWNKRESCENKDKFQRKIIDGVTQLLAKPPCAIGTARSKEQVDDCISRLVVVVPFYSIEAWLFQNTDQLIENCRKKCRSRHQKHKRVLLSWADNPKVLEELDKPKEQYCLKATKNRELAETSFPWPKLESVGKSYSAFVKDLETRPRVVEVLALTA